MVEQLSTETHSAALYRVWKLHELVNVIVNELCYKKVIDLANGDSHYVALTKDGYIAGQIITVDSSGTIVKLTTKNQNWIKT